jgi:hypothetical protein
MLSGGGSSGVAVIPGSGISEVLRAAGGVTGVSGPARSGAPL